MNSQVWVEVSINIGKKCLRIEIEREECIEDVVNQFINSNRLSTKYEPIITNMIKQQIKNRIQSQQEVKTQPNPKNNQKPNNQSNSVVSSTSSLSESNSGLMSQIMRIQEETNRKRNQKLAELRQSSLSKNGGLTENSFMETQRLSMKRGERDVSNNDSLEMTPKMAVDTSRQVSTQTFRYETEQSSKQLKNEQSSQYLSDQSNIHSRANILEQTQKDKSRVITEDIAQLKQLLSYNQEYNTNSNRSHTQNSSNHNKSSGESSICNDIPNLDKRSESKEMKPKRFKTQTPENIYQKWKKLEEKKRVESNTPKAQQINKLQPKSKSPLVKRQDNFFYNKGKSFLEEKNKKIQTKFNQIYPFKTSKTPLNSKVGVDTTDRLFKQSKDYFSKKIVKPRHVDLDLSLKPDPIREKVRKRDKEQDEILCELIKEGRVKSPATIKYKDKSPFRKTVIFN